ncbi:MULTISPECIES: sulfotransferase domain-containing protein [unclassified Blastococcus]
MSTSRAPAPGTPASSTPPAATRVLFLGGLGRSGTTVLERVLGELPETAPAGELVHLWQRGVLDDEMCGCGEAFGRCPFWTAVGARAFGGWDEGTARRMRHLQSRVDRTRHVPLWALGRLPRRRRAELAEYVGTFARLYRAIADVSGRPVVIDSSKHSSLAFCLRHSPGVDLRVVHVVRDSRGVAYSWTKEVQRPEATTTGDLMARYSPARSSALWLGHNLLFALLRRLGTATLVLRYEDFVAHPRERVAEIADFAGLSVDGSATPFSDDRTVQLTPSHTVAGNPVRFRNGPLTLRRDDAWRARLPWRGRLAVTLLTLPLLAHHRYLRRSAR